MLPTLLVAAAATAPGAPIPRDVLPPAAGPAPRVLTVKPDANGAIWINATIYQKRKVQQQFFVMENGKQVMKQQEQEILASTYIRKGLGDYGGKFTTVKGTPLSTEQVSKLLVNGGTLLITADGRPIDAGWQKAMHEDGIVMVTDELAQAFFHSGAHGMPATASPRLVMLGTDEKGIVRLPVSNGVVPGYGYNPGINRFQARPVMINAAANVGVPAVQTTPAGADGKKAIADIRFEAYDIRGKLISRTEALDRLRAGGLALIAGDNQFPDEGFLESFRGDLLVLVSPELIFPPGMPNPYDHSVKGTDAQPTTTAAAPAPAARVRIAPVVN
jgi:hypothetical protein